MRRVVITAGIFLGMLHSLTSAAQQRHYYTQYILNNFIINPAVAGIENYWDVKASHRVQWVGLPDAPVTTYLTMNGPLRKSDFDRNTATTVRARGTNPRGEAYWKDYTAAEPHQGLGFTVLNDRTGPIIPKTLKIVVELISLFTDFQIIGQMGSSSRPPNPPKS
jgi:hypothetical protein